MSSTLASLGLPEPEPVKPDTLAALGLPEPRRGRVSDEEARAINARIMAESPIADEGLGPLSLIPLFRAGGAGYRAGEKLAGPLKNWLLNRAARGAVSGAAGGAVEAASRQASPLPFVAGGAAGGALLGPAAEAAIPAAGRLLTGLRGKSTGAGKPPISPVEPTSAPPLAKDPVAPGPASTGVPQPPAAAAPAASAPKGFDQWRAGIWDDVKRGTFHPEEAVPSNADLISGKAKPTRLFRGMSDAEMEAAKQSGEFKPLRPGDPDLYVTPDPDRLSGGAYGAKGGGYIVEFDPAPLHKATGRLIDVDEVAVERLPLSSARRVWKWNQDAKDHVLVYERPTSAAVPEPVVPVPPTQPKAVPPPQPVTGENAQQFPALGDFAEQVKADPAFLARVKKLGGGRVVSNQETLARAVEAGPMPPAELAAWKADTPLDPVTQTRGLLTFDYFQQARTKAIAAGDLKAAAAAQRTIAELMPGVTNLRATGGRVTQAQAMFVQDEMSKILDSLADMQAKGVPFEQVQAKANEMLRQAEVAARGKRLSSEWREALGGIETAATFAKLTSPVTHAVNTISNALTFGVVRPLEKAGTALAYLGQSNAPAARAEVSTMFGTRMGFRSGFERYIKTLMDDVAEPGKLAEVTGGRNIPLPRALRPFDVFRQLAAADGFWKGVLRDARLNELAHRSAAGEGLKGPALAARIKALMDDPPAQWVSEVDDYAKEFTFQSDPDRFLSAVQKVQGLPFVRLFIPFVQTPYNLARFQFQRSGGGLLSPRNVQGLVAGGDAQAEAIGRLTAGAGLSAGALALVSTTEATGDYPSDPRERERWKASGIKPYSIRTPSGTWIAYNRFAPVGMYIGQAVALREAMERGDEQGVAGAASTLAASSLKQINDMPFLSGLSDLLDAIKEPERGASRFSTGVVTGLVPNIARDVRQQTDPVMREARGGPQAVQNMIPGLSQRLPASLDVLGRERTYEPSRLLRATKVLSTQRESPEGALFAKLEWSPNAPSLTLERGKAKATLVGKEAEAFKREMGTATAKAIKDALAARPNFDRLDREEQIEILQRAVDQARKPVRKKWTDKTVVLKGRL